MSIWDTIDDIVGSLGRQTVRNIGVIPRIVGTAGHYVGNVPQLAANAASSENRLADVIRGILNSQGPASMGRFSRTSRTRQEVPSSARDPLGELYLSFIERLQEPAGVDEASLMAMARGQLDPVYDARRVALQNMLAQTEAKTERGRDDIEAMYDTLGEDYERLAPEAAAQAKAYKQSVEQLYGTTASNIEGHFSRIAGEQGDLFEKLGIEAAAPGVIPHQAELAQQATTSLEQLSAAEQQRALDMGNIDQSYYRQGAPLARLQGANASSDLLQQLMDFRVQTNSDLGMLEAERTAGIQDAFTRMLMQAQGQASQTEQSRIGMLFDLLQGMQPDMSDVPPADAFLQGLPPEISQSVGEAFRSIERSPEVIQGRVEDPRHPVPGTFNPITDAWWLEAATRMFESGQIDESTYMALMQFLRLRNED